MMGALPSCGSCLASCMLLLTVFCSPSSQLHKLSSTCFSALKQPERRDRGGQSDHLVVEFDYVAQAYRTVRYRPCANKILLHNTSAGLHSTVL